MNLARYLHRLSKTSIVMFVDFLAALVAAPLALLLGHVSLNVADNVIGVMMMWLSILIIMAFVFPRFRLYSSLWRFASTSDFLNTTAAVTVTCAIFYILNIAMSTANIVPELDGRAFIIYWLILAVFVGCSRLAYRQLSDRLFVGKKDIPIKSAIFVGIISEASLVMKQLELEASANVPRIGHIIATNDGQLDGSYLSGVMVRRDISRLNEIIATSNNSSLPITHMIVGVDGFDNEEDRIEVIRKGRAAGLNVHAFRGISKLDENGPSKLFREIDVLSMLKRKQNKPDENDLALTIASKRIMVTGGAGSIGSQLAKRCLALGAAEVVIVDRSEPSVFHWLKSVKDEDKLRARGHVADVSNKAIMSRLFRQLRPDVVFHAAALKHVPLVETNWASAIMTNIVGTWTCAALAKAHGVERFVFISTDKAAEPSTFLGYSKRMGELITGSMGAEYDHNKNGHPHTAFTSVRFGNVFRTEGSVVNVFEEQIRAGGPVTITDRNMKRFFMTAREASDLVILSASIDSRKKEHIPQIYILEMGDQIKIIDIANIMIRLAGKTPGGDIEIAYTGTREFEKLEEILVGRYEETISTENENVIAARCPIVDLQKLENAIDRLLEITVNGDREDAIAIIKSVEQEPAQSNADVIPLPLVIKRLQ